MANRGRTSPLRCLALSPATAAASAPTADTEAAVPGPGAATRRAPRAADASAEGSCSQYYIYMS